MRKLRSMIAFTFAVTATVTLNAQDQTVGLFVYDSASFAGYTLFAPQSATTTYLIDNYGRTAHSWECTCIPALTAYLLENGNLIRPCRQQGVPGSNRVQEVTWDGTVVWEFPYDNDQVRRHHDVEPMPNGNVLILAWEFKTKEEAIAAGRDSATVSQGELWPEHIVEVEPVGSDSGVIVWEWHVWDHLIQDYDSTKENYGVVRSHPELMDINYFGLAIADWLHANSVDYNAELDQIIISNRSISEIWVIDHSTTTEEAAGHSGGNSGMGGDLLYRWGNPQVYRAGDSSDQRLFSQHDARWIEPGYPGEGNILVFNNGNDRGYSSVDEIVPPVDGSGHYSQPPPGTPFGPDSALWTYVNDPPQDFLAWALSGAHRLSNGNTVICSGPEGEFFEVTPEGQIVWHYVNPVGNTGPVPQGTAPSGNSVFRCTRYEPDYPGLQGHDLSPGGAIEIYPVTIAGTSHQPSVPAAKDSVVITATITDADQITLVEVYVDMGTGFFPVTMFDDGVHYDSLAGDDLYGGVVPPPADSTSVSYYVYAQDETDSSAVDPPNPPATTYRYFVSTPCGNIDGITHLSGPTDVADLTFLVTYLFESGPRPPVIDMANVDGITGPGGPVDVADLVYLVAYLFLHGPEPVC